MTDIESLKNIVRLMVANDLASLKKLDVEPVLSGIKNPEECLKLAKEWLIESGSDPHILQRFDIVEPTCNIIKTIMFHRAASQINAETADWFRYAFDFEPPVRNLLFKRAVLTGNVQFARWVLSTYGFKQDICMRNCVQIICDKNPLTPMIDVLRDFGILQLYGLNELRYRVRSLHFECVEYILRECTFTDAEIESIKGLPEKYRPLGPKSCS